MNKRIEFSKEEKGIIAKLVTQSAPQANEGDINYFLYYCELYGLNPITGDAVLQKYGKNPQILTTRDGWIKAASQMPGYVGPPIAHPIYEGDDFEIINGGTDVRHERNTASHNIIGAYAVMHHKEYYSITQTADMRDYFSANSGKMNNKKQNVWDKYPSAMIVKIAEVFALRRMFPLGQVHTQEEMATEETTEIQASPSDMVDNHSQKNSASTNKETEKTQPKQDPVINNKEQEILKGILNTIVELTGQTKEKLLESIGQDNIETIKQSEMDQVKKNLQYLRDKAKKKYSKQEETSSDNTEEQPSINKEDEKQAEEDQNKQESDSSAEKKEQETKPEGKQKENNKQHGEMIEFTVAGSTQTESQKGVTYYQVASQEDLSKGMNRIFVTSDDQTNTLFNDGVEKGEKVKGQLIKKERNNEVYSFLFNAEKVQ